MRISTTEAGTCSRVVLCAHRILSQADPPSENKSAHAYASRRSEAKPMRILLLGRTQPCLSYLMYASLQLCLKSKELKQGQSLVFDFINVFPAWIVCGRPRRIYRALSVRVDRSAPKLPLLKRIWVLHKRSEVRRVEAFADLVTLDCYCIHALRASWLFRASRTCKSKTVSLGPPLGLPPHGSEASYRKTWNVSRVRQPQPAEHIVISDRVRTGEFNQYALLSTGVVRRSSNISTLRCLYFQRPCL